MGDLRNGQAIQPFSLPLHDFPFPLFPPPGLESISSMKEVLLMMGKGMKQDFHNTDLASSKPCCVQFTQRGGGCEGSLMELWVKKGKKREKQNKTTPSLSFLKLQEKLRDGMASSGDIHS